MTETEQISETFSRELKIEKAKFISENHFDASLVESYPAKLAQLDLTTLTSDDAKIAFWCNLYNGITNYWILHKRIRNNISNHFGIFFLNKVQVGDHRFSLDDIEHGILRLNRRAPYKLWRQFGNSDPRLKLLPGRFDNRIHFALNCGAKSCPPIAFYSATQLDSQLATAKKNFAKEHFIVDQNTRTLSVSNLFTAFKNDFPDEFLLDRRYKGYKNKTIRYDWKVA